MGHGAMGPRATGHRLWATGDKPLAMGHRPPGIRGDERGRWADEWMGGWTRGERPKVKCSARASSGMWPSDPMPHACAFVRICAQVCTSVHLCACVSMRAHTCVSMRAHTFVSMRAHTCVSMRAHTCVSMRRMCCMCAHVCAFLGADLWCSRAKDGSAGRGHHARPQLENTHTEGFTNESVTHLGSCGRTCMSDRVSASERASERACMHVHKRRTCTRACMHACIYSCTRTHDC